MLDLIGSGNSTRLVRDTIVEVLDSEAPIVAERLGRLVANCFDLVTVRQARIDAILQLVPKNCQEKTPLGVVVWATPEQRKEWTSYRISTDDQRTFAEVPLPELVNALVFVVAESPGIAADAAMRDVASQFGLKKLGAKVRERLDAAVTWGTRHKVLDVDNDQLSIPR